MRAGHLDKVYFIKPPYSDDLQDYDKDLFHRDVDRSSVKAKVGQLMASFDKLWTSMKFNYILRSSNWLISLLFTYENAYRDISFYLIVIVNLMCLFSFASENPQERSSRLNDVSLFGLDHDTSKFHKIFFINHKLGSSCRNQAIRSFSWVQDS